MAIYLAVAASLLGLSVVIRILRFALVLVVVAVVAAAISGHQPASLGQLAHLL